VLCSYSITDRSMMHPNSIKSGLPACVSPSHLPPANAVLPSFSTQPDEQNKKHVHQRTAASQRTKKKSRHSNLGALLEAGPQRKRSLHSCACTNMRCEERVRREEEKTNSHSNLGALLEAVPQRRRSLHQCACIHMRCEERVRREEALQPRRCLAL